MKGFLIALQFLTILPIEIKSGIEEKDFGRSLVFFPVVGLLIGITLSLTFSLFGFLPDPLRCALVVVASIVVTGGIHLDGFIDTCDAFYGSKPKERVLEIMRDSRIGVMGAVGLACLLLLKFSSIVSVPPDILWRPLTMMTVFARWAQVFACFSSIYVRKDGKAKPFVENVTRKEVVIGALFTLAVFLLMAGIKGAILFILTLALIFLFINYVRHRIGGMTGDTIGATSEISEVAVLLFYAILK